MKVLTRLERSDDYVYVCEVTAEEMDRLWTEGLVQAGTDVDLSMDSSVKDFAAVKGQLDRLTTRVQHYLDSRTEKK